MDTVASNKSEQQEELLRAYHNALYEGDLITQLEILAQAEHNPILSTQLESIEQEAIAETPDMEIDWECVTGNIEKGATIQRILDGVITSLQRSELMIRAVFNIWPVAAAIIFGLACFILAKTESPTEMRFWLFVAVVSLGSILIVCATSLWRLPKTSRNHPGPPNKSKLML